MTCIGKDPVPKAEPVGEVTEVSDNGFKCEFNQRLAVGTKLYIAPPLPVQEPWGACVSGRVFVGRLPEHARKISEDEGAPIQWLYTTPPLPVQPVQEPVAYDYHTKYDRGCYKCRSQFCPGNCIYTTPPLPVQEQQQAKPMAWDKPSASFDEWWDSDRRRDTANPFTTDSFAYWAWEGWQAAQRPWVGLTEDEKFEMAAAQYGWEDLLIAAEAKLKGKNT